MHEDQNNDVGLSVAVSGPDETRDRAAFEQIFRATLDPLIDFAVTLGLSRAEAQDVVSDVFLNIWRNRAQWRPVHIRAYLFGAVRRRACNERTIAKRDVDILSAMEDASYSAVFIDSSLSPAETTENKDLFSRIDTVMATLPPMRRAVVTLRLREQLSYAEIAQVFGISENSAQAHVSRAIKAIKDAISG